MIRFTAGVTYATRSICDHDCIFRYKVLSRTKHSLVLEDNWGSRKRRRIQVHPFSDAEMCLPEGRYSMCPVLTADKTAAAIDAEEDRRHAAEEARRAPSDARQGAQVVCLSDYRPTVG